MGKILFSNSFNQTEYLRTLAKLGQNTFALRVMNDAELCSYILEHGASLPEGDFISSKEANYIYYCLSGLNYGDAKNLRSAIDSYRDCVIGDIYQSLEENLSDDFPEKKEQIKTEYQAYQEYKKDHGLYDKQDLMNFILNSDIHIDEECLYYEEFGITKLLLEVLKHVFSKVTSLSLNDTFTKQEKDIHFLRAYGKPCEADYIFSQIQKLPIDECQIILTNSGDSLEIIKTAEALNIPYTSHIGTPVISTKAGILLNYLFQLDTLSYGVDGYKALFNCPSFNSGVFKAMIPDTVRKPERKFADFIKYAGWLRINFESNSNCPHQELYEQYHFEMLSKLQESMSHGRAHFIKEYIINPTPLDEQIIEQIRRLEEESERYGFELEDVLKELLGSSINRKVSQSGHLYITDINSAISSLRKYNFIIGLTSDFPGGPKENYLIFDEEYSKTGSDLYLSQEIVKRKEKVLRALINASQELYLTYPYFELASLEDKNPSSVIFDLYKGGDINTIPTYGYRDMQLDINKEVYTARLDNLKSDLPDILVSIPYDKDKLLSRQYSPSTFHQYFEEENQTNFILSNILEIEGDEEDDPYVLIPRNEMGTLIHEVFERFDKNKNTYEEIREKAERAFANFLLKKPPMIRASIKKAEEDYMKLVEGTFKMDPSNSHVFSEKWIEGSIGGILFGGKADRLERTKFGKFILVDYKTGSNITHKQDDVISCLQGLIYAYLFENYGVQCGLKNNILIDHIEFRYPEHEKTISIAYNQENKKELLRLMSVFKTDVENGQLFKHLDDKKWKKGDYKNLDKFAHLFSLMKGVRSV